jgi:hypothetical protein
MIGENDPLARDLGDNSQVAQGIALPPKDQDGTREGSLSPVVKAARAIPPRPRITL